MVTRDKVLNALPPFNNRLVLIEGAQDVPDIIEEVLAAHKAFAKDYDNIYKFFDKGTTREICKRIFDFCKSNILYVVEGEEQQTTKAPQAVLSQGFGDCKHYAGIVAGILSAIVRNTDKRIDWKYRFASYSMLTREPGHVFVVVNDRNGEIWIDPVLSSFDERMQPCFITDKKIKDMPLYRISGAPRRIGFDPVTIATAATTVINFVKMFAGDKVPNYPIGSLDTLQKIKAEISALLPLPPTDLDNAKMLLQKAKELQAPLVGDNDNVRKTYYMIYGEVITALQNYIAQKSGGQTYVDPVTGETLTAGAHEGSWIQDHLPIVLIAGAGLFFLLKPKRRSAKY